MKITNIQISIEMLFNTQPYEHSKHQISYNIQLDEGDNQKMIMNDISEDAGKAILLSALGNGSIDEDRYRKLLQTIKERHSKIREVLARLKS